MHKFSSAEHTALAQYDMDAYARQGVHNSRLPRPERICFTAKRQRAELSSPRDPTVLST